VPGRDATQFPHTSEADRLPLIVEAKPEAQERFLEVFFAEFPK
jgi:hypothetical protein